MERTIRSLTRHYPRRDETVVQVLAVLDRFQGVLNPEQSDFTYDDGRVELLLSLTGVLPIPIQANTYHCPIVFWLPLDFPSTPPIVFILPSETLAVRKGKNVDAGGRVNVQFLEQWSRKSEGCSLLSLIEELIPIFSARYPVTTIQPKAPARPSPPASSSTQTQSTSAMSPASQTVPARPPLPIGSPASLSRAATNDSTASPAPPRPPLPGQSFVNGRPSSVSAAEIPRRPMNYGESSMTNGAPPRPPPPPGMSTAHSTLPPGPPPGYHPPPNSTSIPPYNVPQRSATTVGFSASEPRPPSMPFASPPPFPPQPPITRGPEQLSLGNPISPPPINSLGRGHHSASQPLQPPHAPPLPLPGTFSPMSSDQNRQRLDSTTTRGNLPPRPVSPTASTVRPYSPAQSSIAAPPSTSFSSPRSPPQPDSRHYRQDSLEHSRQPPNRHNREYADSSRPHFSSAAMPPSPPPQAHADNSRSHLPPLNPPVRPYSPAPSSAATSVPPSAFRPPQPPTFNSRSQPDAHRSQYADRQSSAASATSPSEYDAEYGSYMPPAMSSAAISVAGEGSHYGSVGDEMSDGVSRMSLDRDRSINQRSQYEPYQPAAQHESRYSQQPRPPSAVFDPVVESRSRPQHQSNHSVETTSQASSSYYPPHPPQQPVLPPPVGSTSRQNSYAPSPISAPRQIMRNPIRKPAPPPSSSTTTTTSINILDAADEDLDSNSSVNVPSSPTSVSVRGGPTPTTAAAAATQAPPPIPPNPALLALRTRLHSKLSSSLSTLHASTTQEHLEPLSLMNSDLLKAIPAIEDEMARLRAVRDVCLNVRDRYKEVVEEGEKRMGEYERRGEGVDVDEIVCGSTVVYTQLLDLVAEDAALEDTIYALGRGLNSGSANIDLDLFLKRVRTLAREQFIKRATINKILLGLAIRRERNQQQQRERSNAVENGGSRNGSGQGGRGTPIA